MTVTMTTPVDLIGTPSVHAVSAFTIARMRNGEMPLFLTANEIMQVWQPLDADRDEVRVPDECWCGAWDNGTDCECENDDCWYSADEYENDDALWERKYNEVAGSVTGDDILVNGVRSPISLQWHPTSVGSCDMPEILGGHHRVALMSVHKPHVLMPVGYFLDPDDAADCLGPDY